MRNVGLITERTFNELMDNGFTLLCLDITRMRMLYSDSDKNIVVSLTIKQESDGTKWYSLINEMNVSEYDWQHMTTADKIAEFEHRFGSLAYFARVIQPVAVKLLSEEGFEDLCKLARSTKERL